MDQDPLLDLHWVASCWVLSQISNFDNMSLAVVQCIEKTDKHYMLAVDAGQSMQLGGVLGCELLTPLVASAAMMMLFVRSEPNYHVVAMTHTLQPLDIRCASSLNDICTAISEVCCIGS